MNKTIAAYYFHRLGQLIYLHINHLEMFDGEVEADESYFGGRRKGKRGRGATGKVPVFGLLKRNGQGLHSNGYSHTNSHAYTDYS